MLKGAVDPVTRADREAEDAIVEVIEAHRPEDAMLKEETGLSAPRRSRRWIIDPLDGTVNFVHGLPHVGVSVALYQRRVPLVGVVVDVFSDQTYWAEAGGGSKLEGKPLQVSPVKGLGEALVATGFPYDRQQMAPRYAAALAAVLRRVQGVRRMGSAALDLAYVAGGRFDGFWEFLLAPWDVAAGLLLVKEAGGVVVDHLGAPFLPGGPVIVAGAPAIVEQLAAIVAEHVPAHVLP